jgi:hypothetical protein
MMSGATQQMSAAQLTTATLAAYKSHFNTFSDMQKHSHVQPCIHCHICKNKTEEVAVYTCTWLYMAVFLHLLASLHHDTRRVSLYKCARMHAVPPDFFSFPSARLSEPGRHQVAQPDSQLKAFSSVFFDVYRLYFFDSVTFFSLWRQPRGEKMGEEARQGRVLGGGHSPVPGPLLRCPGQTSRR